MFLVVFLIYPYIITDDNIHSMDELLKAFPPDVLKAFNMDISSISTAYGWFKTEGFMFVLLIIVPVTTDSKLFKYAMLWCCSVFSAL